MSKFGNSLVYLFGAISLLQTSSAVIHYKGIRKSTFNKEEGKTLNGHVISSTRVSSGPSCILKCMINIQCQSSNFKPNVAADQNNCELNSQTRLSSPGNYVADAGSIHYYDHTLENTKTCKDLPANGVQENGIFNVTATDGKVFPVFCDFTSEPGSVWTLISSFAYKNRHMEQFCTKGYIVDAPINNDAPPNWAAYRLSLTQMQSLSGKSTHIRITTQFRTKGVDYRDYLRSQIAMLNILTLNAGRQCLAVDLINIRGYSAQNSNAPFWQFANQNFHTDSPTTVCAFNAGNGAVHSENNFGTYCHKNSGNPHFRGCENDESTTEYWFGSQISN